MVFIKKCIKFRENPHYKDIQLKLSINFQNLWNCILEI